MRVGPVAPAAPVAALLGALLGALLAALLALAAPAVAGEAAAWTLEDGSRLGFVARQSGSAVEGGFARFTAEIVFDPDDLEAARVVVEIDMASVDSQAPERDQSIRSGELFAVERYPGARFEADRFVHLGGADYQARGRLTIRDSTLELALPFTLVIEAHPDDSAALRAHAVGEAPILRLDYGVGQGQWRDTTVVADEVLVTFDILARRPKP